MTLSFSSLSGGTSFTVITSTGGSKTATLTKTFPAGTYLIESMTADTNLEVYLGASDGTQVGSSAAGAKSVTASASFLYVTTVNADTNDAVTFTLKSAATLVTKTDAVWAPPTITDITPSGLPNINDTTTITGTNFASNVEVKFRKSDDSTLVSPKTTVRGSATSIIAGRPDSFAVGDAPYDIIVTNPSTTLSATSLNAITSGSVPVWVTSSTLNEAQVDLAFSQTIQATDADGGSSITYAIVSGSLQTGLSLNTSTGAITGTPTGSAGSTSVTISATDSGGNAVNRTFTQVISVSTVLVNYLVIAGGGGGGSYGANTDGNNGAYSPGINGTNSSFSGDGITSVTSLGGGNGGAYNAQAAGNGGSGGGGGGQNASGTTAGGSGTTAQGFGGGTGFNTGSSYYGGGGGGAGAAGQNAANQLFGAGGAGQTSSITGTSVTRAGGGGGGGVTGGGQGSPTGGAGGAGGGGNGAINNTWHNSTNGNGGNGTANTGGGGGAGDYGYGASHGGGGAGGYRTSFGSGNISGRNSAVESSITLLGATSYVVTVGAGGNGGNSSLLYGKGGNGGSGIVIIRAPRAAISTTGSPTTTTSGSDYIYQFLNNGTITF